MECLPKRVHPHSSSRSDFAPLCGHQLITSTCMLISYAYPVDPDTYPERNATGIYDLLKCPTRFKI